MGMLISKLPLIVIVASSPATSYLHVVKGLRDLLSKFWDPLHISETVEARNFKFGTQIDHRGNNEKMQN